MREGHVFYADHEHVHVLRYVGDIRFTLAPSISTFVDSLFEHLNGGDLVLDLSDADAIDSTNLGEIARMGELLWDHSHKRAAIISTRPEINQVLYSMAFDEIFDICTEAREARDGTPIPKVSASQELSLRMILEAHRRLMEMSESNRRQFCEVVELMERDLASQPPQH
jgi:anti-anti-sigma factor